MISVAHYSSNKYKPIQFQDILSALTYDELSMKSRDKLNDFIKKLCTEMILTIHYIFTYTLEHLSKRRSAQQPLIELPLIEDKCREIDIALELLPHLSDPMNCFNVIIDILQKLYVLGGARSILKGNVVDLMVSLKLFLKKHEVCDV